MLKSAIFILSFVILISGCVTVKEAAKSVAGISTKELESSRKDAVKKNFNYDYFTCYTKALDILKSIGTYIYAQDIKKHLIAIYVSELDTTAVGIFFTEAGNSNTQVEVSSRSTYAKEHIASKLFPALENK